MILALFTVLIAISLAFIVVGLMKQDKHEMALVGFVLLFLLSFVILNGQLQYEIGANLTTSGNNTYVVYNNAFYSGSNAHTMGYYMVIISFVGFVGVLFGLTSAWKKESAQKKEMEEYS